MRQALGTLIAMVVGMLGCDTKQNFEAPEWTLSRMLEQPRYAPFGESSFFTDGKAMRAPVPGTVARNTLLGPEKLVRGTDNGTDVVEVPLAVTHTLLVDGERNFNVVCAACHGVRGDGSSPVATKMQLHPPPSLLTADIAGFAAGRTFRVIGDGYGLMMPMRTVLDVRERWAVVAYLQALQLSQTASIDSIPTEARAQLGREAP